MTISKEQEILSKSLLRYGEIKTDLETEEKNGFRRIRVIRLNEKVYFHHQFNGELVEVYEV